MDEDDDELIVGGDYVAGDSSVQHIDDLMISAPGSWREYPLCGINITQFQSAPINQKQTIERIILQQLGADGYTNVAVKTAEDISANALTFSVTGERV